MLLLKFSSSYNGSYINSIAFLMDILPPTQLSPANRKDVLFIL